jgi:transposase
MWFCGIDWAEKHLDFCLETETGDVVVRERISNTEDGFCTFVETCQTHIDAAELAIGIESAHEPIVDFLLARSMVVYPVNPSSIDQYRKSQKVSGSKSDSADAQLIADYLRLHHQNLRAWQVSEPQLRELQLLVNDRDKLVKEKVRLQNQLRSTLRGYFPAALKAFSDLTCPTALDFLSQFPTHLALADQTQQDWTNFLDAHRVFNPKARNNFLKALKQNPITADEAVVSAKSLLTQSVVAQLKPLRAALEVYQKRIEDLLEKSKDGTRFKSLPGVDVILAAKLVCTIGTDKSRFNTANEMQCLFGTAPYTKSSGKSKSVHFRKACHKGLRTALQQMAVASLRSSQWAKSYFAKKRKEGKRAHHALRCLANLWLKVIFAIWKKNKPYDENKHLASITRHQLSQSA